MNAISELKRLPETKAQRETFAEKAIIELENGVYDVLEVEIHLKKLEETIKLIRSNERYRRLIGVELDKYPTSVFDFGNVKFTKKNAVSYDYSNDNTWCKLSEQLKQRQELLKTIKDGVNIADAETGEMLQAPIKKSSESYSITFKK